MSQEGGYCISSVICLKREDSFQQTPRPLSLWGSYPRRFQVFTFNFVAMSKKLRIRFAIGRVKVTGVKMTGTNSAVADYEELDHEGKPVNSGAAACFDVDAVELDDEDCLTGESRLSANGQFIVQRRNFDRTGLGRK